MATTPVDVSTTDGSFVTFSSSDAYVQLEFVPLKHGRVAALGNGMGWFSKKALVSKLPALPATPTIEAPGDPESWAA
jgi:hypothetical protein